jgi:histidine ammonia-lyase
MGMTGALKLKQVVENAEAVLAIELISGAQGLDYRAPLKAARAVEAARVRVRETVPRLGEDRVLSTDIAALAKEIHRGSFDDWAD